MKTSSSRPTVTKKFHIEVPTHTYQSGPSIFKIYFGEHYLIWKGKSMLQACQMTAEGIERYIRLLKNDETDYLYHVCNHIKRTRCIKATVEVLENEFMKGESTVINVYKMLMAEQKYLDKAKKDPMCLNNNAQAYISQWMPQKDVDRFLSHQKHE